MVNTAEIGLIYLQAFSDGDFVGIEYFWERYCGWIIFNSKWQTSYTRKENTVVLWQFWFNLLLCYVKVV